jgi:hypothetical protein
VAQQGFDSGNRVEAELGSVDPQHSWGLTVIVITHASHLRMGEASPKPMTITSAIENQRRMKAV